MIACRPTIGFLGYLLLPRSPLRMTLLLGFVLLITLVFIREGRQTLTLRFRMPSKYPPPVFILTASDQPYLTALDACGIESATKYVILPSLDVQAPQRLPLIDDQKIARLLGELESSLKRTKRNNTVDEMEEHEKLNMFVKLSKINEKNKRKLDAIQKLKTQNAARDADQNVPYIAIERSDAEDDIMAEELFKWSINHNDKRRVIVYLWTKTVFKEDIWAHFIQNLPGVQLVYMNPVKAMENTPLSGWSFRAGLSMQKPWFSWLAAAAGLLWNTGGLLLQPGVVLTRPLAVTSVRSGIGVLTSSTKQEGHISTLAVGTPAKHVILEELMNILANGSMQSSLSPERHYAAAAPLHSLTPAGTLLTSAVIEGCGTSQIPYLFISDCADFTILPATETKAYDLTQPDPRASSHTLLHYSGAASDFNDPALVRDLFRRAALYRYCPVVTMEVLDPVRDESAL